jgi:hypothetical protein
METSMLRLVPLVIIAIGFISLLGPKGAAFSSIEQVTQTPTTREVNVYFYRDPGEYIDLSAVKRRVTAASPARGAIEALLEGPSEEERHKGFEALAGAIEFGIGSLKISGGTARVNFVASRTWSGWSGDLAPVRFKKAVELTLKQFSGVRHVIVSLNGDPNFADER